MNGLDPCKVYELYMEDLDNKRLIKPLLVVRVGPGTNPKYGSHWTESLIATLRKRNGTQKLTRDTTSNNQFQPNLLHDIANYSVAPLDAKSGTNH